MKDQKINLLIQQGLTFFKKFKVKNVKRTTYTCPHCGATLNAIQPNIKQVVTSGCCTDIKRCYKCGKEAFVKIWYDGETETACLK